MKLSLPSSRHSLTRVAAIGVATFVLLASAIVPVLAAPSEADPPTAPTAAAGPARDTGERLERLYQHEQKLLAAEQKRLERLNDLISRAQGRIDALKDRGRDVSRLQAALSAFKTAVANARGDFDTAKGALDAHSGFGPNGEVTDASQARSTLKTAGDAMRRFHQALKGAVAELQKALRLSGLAGRLTAEEARLGGEAKRLDQANNLVDKIQARIDALNGKGRDTSGLVSALNTFKDSVSTAKGDYDSAKATLDAHAGFDASGQVTDPSQARSTLQSAQNAMQQFRKTLRQALVDLHKAIHGFRASSAPAR